jgi:hypothetical protein
MRRNLIGKKLPQQPKIRWTDTVRLDAVTSSSQGLKAIRDANSDLPLSSDVHWRAVADGATNQFKKGDHFALSSAYSSNRSFRETFAPLQINNQALGTVASTLRSGRRYIPSVGGNTVADFTQVVAGTGSISNVPGGGVAVQGGAGSNARLGWSSLSGLISYQGTEHTIEQYEKYRVRIKLSNVTAPSSGSSIFPVVDGTVLTNERITEDGVYTWYCRSNGNDINFALQFDTIATGNVSATVDYMHLDVNTSTASPWAQGETQSANTQQILIGVRANGATAYVDMYDAATYANRVLDAPRSLYASGMMNTNSAYGRTSEYRPGHETDYVYSGGGNVLEDAWWGHASLCLLPMEDLWYMLYANNSAIGADIDPTAEWYVADNIPLKTVDWQTDVDADLALGLYDPIDAWVKDNQVQIQTSIGAVAVPSWDGVWKRRHMDTQQFARNTTAARNQWAYQSYNNADFNDEPNGFTIEALGIVLGAQAFYELCDMADGSQLNTGTPAFRGARGKINTSGHDFSVLASGHEYATSYGELDSSVAINTPNEFEWRHVTFIGESGQLADLESSSLDTEGLNHWSHAGGVFGFAN